MTTHCTKKNNIIKLQEVRSHPPSCLQIAVETQLRCKFPNNEDWMFTSW